MKEGGENGRFRLWVPGRILEGKAHESGIEIRELQTV